MALDAMCIEQRRDVLAKRNALRRLDGRGQGDHAPIDGRLNSSGISSREDCLQRIDEVVGCYRWSFATEAILVIDPPAVSNAALSIEHDDFGSSLDAQCSRARAVRVFQ